MFAAASSSETGVWSIKTRQYLQRHDEITDMFGGFGGGGMGGGGDPFADMFTGMHRHMRQMERMMTAGMMDDMAFMFGGNGG